MEENDILLLMKDLCCRLPYGVIGHYYLNDSLEWGEPEKVLTVDLENERVYTDENVYDIENFRPYLRPMSSMTEEEHEELLERLPKYWSIDIDKLGDLYFDIGDASYPDIDLFADIIDWLNNHHFDYRGLIKKNLAICVTEYENPYKNI